MFLKPLFIDISLLAHPELTHVERVPKIAGVHVSIPDLIGLHLSPHPKLSGVSLAPDVSAVHMTLSLYHYRSDHVCLVVSMSADLYDCFGQTDRRHDHRTAVCEFHNLQDVFMWCIYLLVLSSCASEAIYNRDFEEL